jgi:hypothetical protein
MSRKDCELLLRRARRAGFTVERTGSQHWRITAPSGATTTAAATPSDRRAPLKLRRDLRRIGLEI